MVIKENRSFNMMKKYGGSKNEFIALSTVGQIDNGCLVRTLQHDKVTHHDIWSHASSSRRELSLPPGIVAPSGPELE